jgi:methylenetetrahydrofolate dehydrogenase (NADP+) / methenyltetrahydrofolate cyclohydrolase
MPAAIIDGKKIAADIRNEVREAAIRLKNQHDVVPGLGFILVGENPASQSYVRSKGKACAELGFHSETLQLPDQTSEKEVLSLIRAWNGDRKIHGILVQLPLPSQINEHRVIESIDPNKDVDGFHPMNVGKLVIGLECFKPCTPVGIQELLKRSNIDPSGKHVVVVGRSNIVGKPIANMMLQKQLGANAVVTVAHTAARDITAYTREADILIAAVGKAEMITGEMLKPGAVVIDVGINRIPDPSSKTGNRLVGDVHFPSAALVASAITPVPGGVGPMTIALLMRSTLIAAERSLG